ncbi:R3H and G-patch domain protein, putative [Talaromyces stipitatus ATCC 10500]|uniref:Protein SQS1 n=1 Tax=Talaromyces stipitatus (strain ATCC 10500 / CBS 375.48 / QM 6759 / NRRL 1006) TaxID=441959 RepID=B8MNS5_TALSN|nr:R3H and G-patch domain protein, putative [Talaromyces stipitatus ATCC 10500]EED14164.1 R3H and G-patch domain protein, putative [Talaromyces stipitatus ATCC 10500]
MSGHEETHDPAAPSHSENTLFFIDSYGERPLNEPVKSNTRFSARPRSNSDLNSSEDEVVFSGRQNQTARINSVVYDSRVQPQPSFSRTAVQVVDDDVQFLAPTPPDKRSATTDPRDPENLQDSYIGLASKRQARNKRKGRKNKRSIWDDDSVFADYVRNVARNEKSTDSSSEDDDASEDEQGLTKEEKAKFRVSSTLEVVEESSMLISEEIEDDDSDEDDNEDSDDTDDSTMLDDIISQIRRGASFTELEAEWASSNDMSLDFFEGERHVDFDIVDMQQDGPLRKNKKKKGRRQMGFDLSDSELEIQLEQAWEKDRNKKKAKKREREQLRAEGLLGKNKKKLDRRGKDKGFGIEGLKIEVRTFLQSQSESLDLPPMKKQHRRVIHELANALMLKSQSRGKGNARFPVLYKTGRTPNFNGKHSVKLDKILAQPRFNLRQSTRMSVSERSSPGPKNIRRRQTTNMGASYLEGEVVGGSAPEIGAENKGRAMLEKMGWSSGTALGALNNKGILQPVAHVVKNTRAGLG